MHKLIVILTLVAACVLLVAAPALAQRDPFAPVIDPNAATTTTTTTTTGSTDTAPFDDQSSGDSGALSNTGSDVSPLLVIAYGLLVLGATAVLLVRINAPTPLRR